MTASLVTYRLMRLRRLAVLATAIPLIAVFANYIYSGSVGVFALVLAVLIPLLHLLRYPGQWHETLNVSFSLFAVILVAGFGHRNGYIADPPYMILLIFVGGGLFLWLPHAAAQLDKLGSRNAVRWRATQMSRLDMPALHKSFMPQPETEDGFNIYGAANDDGFFTVTIKPKPAPERVPKAIADEVEAEAKLDSTLLNALCKVMHDGPDRIEGITVFPDANITVAATVTFEAKENGTLVVIQEYGFPVSGLIRFGLWLADDIADYLTCKIDLAEGLANRSNRLQSSNMLIIDIARFVPQGLADPD